MDLLLAALQHPFSWGLLAGLIPAVFQIKKNWELKAQIKALHNQVVKGNEVNLLTHTKLQEEVRQLKAANQNLRDKIAQFSHSPRGAFTNQVEAYHRAAEALTLQAPGFAQSWALALKKAQEEIAAEIEGAAKPRLGIRDALPFLRLKPRLPQAHAADFHSPAAEPATPAPDASPESRA